jgi:hypothetical protein
MKLITSKRFSRRSLNSSKRGKRRGRVQAIVDPNEPPLPGNITVKQALRFAEALARGERDRWKIIKTVLKDKIREVV